MVQEALDNGAVGIEEILNQSYADVPQEMREWAMLTLKSHLVRLGYTDFT